MKLKNSVAEVSGFSKEEIEKLRKIQKNRKNVERIPRREEENREKIFTNRKMEEIKTKKSKKEWHQDYLKLRENLKSVVWEWAGLNVKMFKGKETKKRMVNLEREMNELMERITNVGKNIPIAMGPNSLERMKSEFLVLRKEHRSERPY